MKKVDLKQGSEEWIEWRKNRITATEAPILMGASPYVTPYKGWQRKVGLVPEQEVNSHMLRGQRDEPIARDIFINQFSIDMHPCCIESEKYDFLGASLDGISACGKYLLEVKSQFPKAIEELGIPEYHYMQMQHQMLCSDGLIERGYYVSHWEGKNITLDVWPDIPWMESYIEKARAFWKCVLFFEAPPLSSKDYNDMTGVLTWKETAEEYRKICDQLAALEESKETYRKQLITLCNGESGCGNGVKVLKKTSKGRICYEKLVQEMQIPDDTLNKYRKEASSSWTVMVDRV